MSLCLASTAILQTLRGQQLWLHRLTHQGGLDSSYLIQYNGVGYKATLKGGDMNLSSKHKGNIALAHALSYFGGRGYYLFLPVGDNGGAIDLAISQDGTSLQRVQCKYTEQRHTSMMKRYPDRPVWVVGMRTVIRRSEGGRLVTELVYDGNSFDLLFAATPGGDYLIDWKMICQELGHVPSNIQLGKNAEKYRIQI